MVELTSRVADDLALAQANHAVCHLYFVSAAVAVSFLAWGIASGNEDYGMHTILAALNFFAAGLFWYRFRRPSAGVLATVFGFFAWGLSFPAGLLLQKFAPSIHVSRSYGIFPSI